jgi:signal transduction histidine kinase/ActR/RegA family two-component response regulator
VLDRTWDYLPLVALAAAALIAITLLLRRAPGARRVTALAWVVSWLALACGWLFVERAGERRLSQLQRMVEGLAPTYARELSHLGHERISFDTPADDPLYLSMIEAQKRWLKANSAIADIYTFRLDEAGRVRLLVDSETDYDRDGVITGDRESRTEIGELFQETPDNALAAAFSGKPVFDREPFTDRWGVWVAAYEPMLDSSGRVEAVLGCDFPAEHWVAERQAARWSAIVAVGLFETLVLTGVVVIAAQNAYLHRHRQAAGTLRKAHDELIEARRRAESASEAKSQFLANMSHEVRTPLTAILGFAESLGDGLAESERGEAVETIRKNGVRLMELVNDILDLSRIEAGKMAVETTRVAPLAVAKEVIDLFKRQALKQGVSLTLSAPAEPLPPALTDPTRLRQILINLVGNAVKFTQQGAVVLAVKWSPSLRRDDRHSAGEIEFRVVDSGIGISPDHLTQIFEPFVQADPSMTRRYGGSGLGLAISRRLATMLGGRLDCESMPGQGSVFRLSLPAAETATALPLANPEARPVREIAATPAVAATVQQAGEALNGVRVLLAEDGPDNQRLISFILRKANVQVTVVEDGQLAIEAVERAAAQGEPFDLLLLDMQMPVLDGYGAARRLRELGFRFPIVALTAHAMEGDREKCIEAGCDDYAAKPIDRAMLLATLARWVSSRPLPV